MSVQRDSHPHGHGRAHEEHRGHRHPDPFSARAPRGARWRWGAGRAGWGGGRRMPRGAVRAAILLSLRDQPAHGYEVMRRLEEMSGGLWRPSPGSVYPHLQMLEDEGMVRSTSPGEGSRVYSLTDEGRAEAEDAHLPWLEPGATDDDVRTLRLGTAQLMAAAKQLAAAGEPSQISRGLAVVQRARKELYQILAED